jgi:hypothetical protein
MSYKLTLVTLIGAIIGLNALTAHAELGDKYATSVQRYGGRGIVSGDAIVWDNNNPNKTNVAARYRDNQCVWVQYIAKSGQSIIESEMWRLLISNARPNQTWAQYNDAQNTYGRSFITDDGTILAQLYYRNGIQYLQIAYRSYLERNHLLIPHSDNNELPPVEEGKTEPNTGEKFNA